MPIALIVVCTLADAAMTMQHKGVLSRLMLSYLDEQGDAALCN
jgi:hypothetical protein